MVIPINIETSQVLKAYLLCLNPMMHLKPRELEVMDAMLKVYFNLKKKAGQLKEEDIDKRLADPVGRKVVRDLINMSEASFNNHYLQLKRKKVITNDNKIQPFLKNINFSNLDITYKIKVTKNEQTKNQSSQST